MLRVGDIVAHQSQLHFVCLPQKNCVLDWDKKPDQSLPNTRKVTDSKSNVAKLCLAHIGTPFKKFFVDAKQVRFDHILLTRQEYEASHQYLMTDPIGSFVTFQDDSGAQCLGILDQILPHTPQESTEMQHYCRYKQLECFNADLVYSFQHARIIPVRKYKFLLSNRDYGLCTGLLQPSQLLQNTNVLSAYNQHALKNIKLLEKVPTAQQHNIALPAAATLSLNYANNIPHVAQYDSAVASKD